MSEFKLVQVDTFFDGLSALQAKDWLNQEGILAFVEGANTNSAFFVGNALAGVKLLVASSDQDRARSALQRYHSETLDQATWYCGDCQEMNEPSFDVCWSCGQSRQDVEASPPPNTRPPEPQTPSDELTVADFPDRMQSTNPYQPPLARTSANRNPEKVTDPDLTQATEDIIQRAWRASIMGLIFPVPIFNLYSVFILL